MLRYIFYPELILLLLLVKELVKEISFVFKSSIIYGKIVDIDVKEKKGKDSFFPVIEVTDQDNNSFQYTHAIGSSHRLKIGKKIKMRKLDNPKKIVIKHSNFLNLFYNSIYIFFIAFILYLLLRQTKALLGFYGIQ